MLGFKKTTGRCERFIFPPSSAAVYFFLLFESAQLLTQTIAEIPPAHLQPLLPAACSGRRLSPGGLRRGETTSRFLRERRRKEREGPGRVWAHCSALLCQEVGDYELIPRPSQKVCRLPPLLPSPPARWRGRRQLAARRWPRSPRSCLIFRPLRRCCAWLRWDRNSRRETGANFLS